MPWTVHTHVLCALYTGSLCPLSVTPWHVIIKPRVTRILTFPSEIWAKKCSLDTANYSAFCTGERHSAEGTRCSQAGAHKSTLEQRLRLPGIRLPLLPGTRLPLLVSSSW